LKNAPDGGCLLVTVKGVKCSIDLPYVK
jgi:hypothetical protein